MHVNHLTDIDTPELRPFRTLRRSKEQYDKGLFIAEGEKVVTRLFQSGLRILTVLLTDEWLSRVSHQLESISPPPNIYAGSQELMETVVGFNLHQGIMALAEMPPELSLKSILAGSPRPHLVLAIDDLLNAENVGVIVRNAHAFGVTCIIVGESSSSPYLRRAVRNSLGTVFSVPIIHSPGLKETVAHLQHDQTMPVYAVESGMEGSDISTIDLSGDVCLIVGGEDKGIREKVIRACDGVLEIPMVEGMDSVNVANAAAIAMFEAQRQRRA